VAERGEIAVVRAGDEPPKSWDASVLLDGPGASPEETSRTVELLAGRWRAGRLVVFLPGSAERAHADLVLETAPDGSVTTTWYDGRPTPGQAGERGADGVADALGTGARREGGERDVPLPVWRTPSFQRWYAAQRHAGNTLLGARAVWTFRLEPGTVFFWALHVRVHVVAEDRVKSNEVVISRPDVSVVALYRRGPTRDQTTVVLVREFRSAASTPDGNVHELPGGSSLQPSTPLAEAKDEVEEETGLAIEAGRFRPHGSRQVAGTMSAHHAHLFSAEITDEELARLRAARNRPYGVQAEDERTWVEIATYGEIRRASLVDWATLGMLATVLD